MWVDVRRFLADPGDILEELEVRAEGDEADRRRETERQAIMTALAELDTERTNLVRLALKGKIEDEELQADRGHLRAGPLPHGAHGRTARLPLAGEG